MKRTPILLAAATLLAASSASADTIDFSNGATDLAKFNLLTSSGTTSTAFSAVGTGGVGNGAAISGTTASTGDSAIYNAASFDFANAAVGDSFTVSAMVKSSTAWNVSTFVVGFSATTDKGFGTSGSNSLYFRTNTDNIRSQAVNNGTVTSGTPFGTTTGIGMSTSNWYEFSFTLTKSAILNNFDFIASIKDWGMDGVTGGTSILTSSPTSITNAALYADSAVFAGFRSAVNSGSTTMTVDNFTTTAVPEPSTYGLMGAGALAAAAVRRRRKNAKLAA